MEDVMSFLAVHSERPADRDEARRLAARLPDFSVYDSVAQPIFVLVQDSLGQVVYGFLNEAGRRNLGVTLEEVIGRSASELFEGRAGQSVLDRQTQAWMEGKPVRYEVALPVLDRTFWARTMLEPVYDADGGLMYMVGTSIDISQEVDLKQAQAMAEATAAEMEEFASLAAHDLRSPIANVKMLADLVRNGFVDMGDGKLQLIGMIEGICTRALELVSDVMSQTAAANAGQEMRTFDLHALCDDILVTLDPGRLHTVTVQRARVHTDYTALQVALRNLIDNSLKHAGSEQTEIAISVDVGTDDRIAVTVCDNGTGFADPALAFLDGGTLRADSGFGLLGVRRLIRSRGGDISALAPTSGRGAEVRFELPGEIIRIGPDQLPDT